MLSHLAGGVLAFAAMPLILLARGGVPSAIELALFAWLVAPIFAALDLSRTGRLERAHFISIASFAGLLFVTAAMTGGIGSFILIWLPVLAIEAAFSGSRRLIVASLGLAALVLVLLIGIEAMRGQPLPVPSASYLPQLSAFAAVAYATGLALRWDTIQVKIAEQRDGDEARYQLLADNTADLVTRHTASGAVAFASPAAQGVLGSAASELQGRGLFERVHVADRPAYLTALSEAARGAVSTAEFRMRKTASGADGSMYGLQPQFIWVEMKCRPAEDGHVVAVTREVSERKQSEGSLQQAHIEVERAQAMKGQFLASMSHELRTPLNAIIGFSELLANDMLVDEKRRQEYAGLIHDSGLHLLSVVNGILDMSRIESGNFAVVAEPFSIEPVVERCMQLFALKASAASVTLHADIATDCPHLFADKRACKQILINLLSNAIKFTPPGGRVNVTAHGDGEHIRIAVTDTGVGIAKEDMPHIGTSFFQARSSYDRPYDGTGLGLSVVKGLVGLQRGSFEVKSEIGKGTSVIVRLPREMTESAARPDEASDEVPRMKHRAMG